MSWQRVYTHKDTGFMPIFFGLVLAFIGLVFSVVFGLLPGILILAGAVIVPLLFVYFGTNTTLTCFDQGFMVRSESKRRGTTEVSYEWHEVTATNYSETRSRDSEGFTRTKGHFTVETVRGKAFTLPYATRGFRDMIEVFNVMTPQIPYVWKPQTGFTLALGPAAISRGAYCCVPRGAQQSQ